MPSPCRALIGTFVLLLLAALPSVALGADASPVVGVRSITGGTAGCTYQPSSTSIYVRSKDCAGSFTVNAVAFDAWGDSNEANTTGLKQVASDTTTSYGVLFGGITGAPVTAGTNNWTSTPHALAGAPKGLRLGCWNNATFTGVAAYGTDTKLDYDALMRGTAQGFRNADTTRSSAGPAGRTGVAGPPRMLQPGVGDLSCEWRGYVTPRGTATGNYAFKIFSDDHMRLDVGASGASSAAPGFSGFDCVTLPAPVACNWGAHAPQFDGGGQVNFSTAWDAHPFRAAWDDRGGQAATAAVWDPPGAPADLAPGATSTGPITGQAGYEVIPASNYVQDIDYSRTYSWTADPADPTGAYSYNVIARDTTNRTTNAAFQVRLDNERPEESVLQVATSDDWYAQQGWTNDHSLDVLKRDNGDADSGIDASAPVTLTRTFAPLNPVTGRCGTPQAPVTITPGAWSYSTTTNQSTTDTVADGCYFYDYMNVDRVGNVGRNFAGPTMSPDDTSNWIRVGTGADPSLGGPPVVTPPVVIPPVVTPPVVTPPVVTPSVTALPPVSTAPPATTPREVPNLAPSVQLSVSATAVHVGDSVMLRYFGSDPEGGALRYRLETNTALWNEYTASWGRSPVTTATSRSVRPTVGWLVSCYRVVAIDAAGAESAPSAARCITASQDDGAFKVAGAPRMRSANALKDTFTKFGPKSALTQRVAGKSLTFALLTCKACGRVELVVDGKVLRPVANTARQVVLQFPDTKVHVVTIRGYRGEPIQLDWTRLAR